MGAGASLVTSTTMSCAGTVIDLGCGTGVAGAAAATSVAPPLTVFGVDTHPWTIDEARFTYKTFGLRSDVRRGHAARTRFPADTSFIVAAFVVNELTQADRNALLANLAATAAPVLIIEPISLRISPWWAEWEAAFHARGGRSDEWRARIEAPAIVRRLAKAAGLRPAILTARSLYRPRQ